MFNLARIFKTICSKMGLDAVYLAIGAQNSRRMGVPEKICLE